ncbi:MAG TPA: HdeA/HdeB family chaperone [Saliniramus sp.]|nr:HdeA/HdeB family chaperone [Saliniramus sp.]
MLRRSVWAISAPALGVCVGLLGTQPASAQVADLARVDCAQFNALPMPERRQLGMWLHGYYTGAAQRPSLDISQLEGAISAMVGECGEHPDRPLLGAEMGATLRGDAVSEPLADGRIIIESEPTQPGAELAVPEQRPRPE